MNYLHTMVRVKDLEASLNFYCQQLGLQEVKRSDHPEGRYSLIFLAAPGDLQQKEKNHVPLLELTYNWDAQSYSSGRNFGHLAYQVENIYHTCNQLKNSGVVIHRPPRDGYMAFIRSPDGISIELLQKGEPLAPQEPWLSAPNVGQW